MPLTPRAAAAAGGRAAPGLMQVSIEVPVVPVVPTIIPSCPDQELQDKP
jgi:hypothetical protein